MTCRLAFYTPEWESQVRSIKLDDSQTGFVFLPTRALDFFQSESVYSVVILSHERPVGFFVLHHTSEGDDDASGDKALFLRALSVDKKHQGKGFATSALHLLPTFIKNNLPYINEVMLTVSEHNITAKRLYERVGFIYNDKDVVRSNGIELGMKLLIN